MKHTKIAVMLLILAYLFTFFFLVSCGNNTPIQVGLKIEKLATLNQGKAIGMYHIYRLTYDGKHLHTEKVGTVQITNHIISPRNFSWQKDEMYLYLPQTSTFSIIEPLLKIYTLPYYNSEGMGSGITPIHGGYIASYNRNYYEIYKGTQRITATNMPFIFYENMFPFIITGYEKGGIIYLVLGYSTINTPTTHIFLTDTTGKIYKTATVKNCVVTCQNNYLGHDETTYKYLLCQKEENNSVILSIDEEHNTWKITTENTLPSHIYRVGTYTIKIEYQEGKTLLYINGKQVDSTFGFYVIK